VALLEQATPERATHSRQAAYPGSLRAPKSTASFGVSRPVAGGPCSRASRPQQSTFYCTHGTGQPARSAARFTTIGTPGGNEPPRVPGTCRQTPVPGTRPVRRGARRTLPRAWHPPFARRARLEPGRWPPWHLQVRLRTHLANRRRERVTSTVTASAGARLPAFGVD